MGPSRQYTLKSNACPMGCFNRGALHHARSSSNGIWPTIPRTKPVPFRVNITTDNLFRHFRIPAAVLSFLLSALASSVKLLF